MQRKTSERDLVTNADFAAEQLIVERLRRARPDDAIVAEEGGVVAGTSGLVWGVDPLDGTTNFVSGIPHWATAVGCEDATGSLVGVVFDPVRDELFAAARGRGATVNGLAAAASRCRILERAVVAFGPAWEDRWREHRAAVSERVPAAVAHVRQMGSLALDLAWTAAGRFDAFYYEAGLHPWDLAMRVVAEEAGLRTVVLEERVDRPGALVAAPPALYEALVRATGRDRSSSDSARGAGAGPDADAVGGR